MEFSKKPPAVLFLDKNGFYFYEEGLPNIISLAFTEDAVRNMDVVNATLLMNQVKLFTEQYQLVPAAISIVLSPNVTFEKDIVGFAHEAQEEAVKNFVDTIPFESVISKTYPIEKGVKVIGFNEDLFRDLKSGFEMVAFSVDSVVPYQLLGADQALITNLTTDNASQFLKRVYRLRQFNMLVVVKEKIQQVAQTAHTAPVASHTEKPKKNNTRLFAMVGIFAVLFAILGYMLMNMNP